VHIPCPPTPKASGCTELTPPPLEVDRVVDSCFQLLSLFFMTIGRNNEAPAAYALTSTIKRLLDHLTEANIFSAKDLESMSQTLERLSAIVGNAPTPESAPYLETLISSRIDRCRESLEVLMKRLGDYAEPILATHEKLVSMMRQMATANTRSMVVHPIPSIFCIPLFLSTH
jgi:hypothetical protein